MSTVNSLLSSIAETEIALANLLDMESKKLKTIINDDDSEISDLLDANKSAERMMRKVITKEMLLSFQLEDVVELEDIDARRPLYPINIRIPIGIDRMVVGQEIRFEAVIDPFNAVNRLITWETSDPAIAVVSPDGVVTAIGHGTVNITARTANGLTAVRLLTIEEIYPSSVSLNFGAVNLGVGRTLQLQATLLPSTATATDIEWTSDENAIASVDLNGLVTALNQGVVTITATTQNMLTATCVITIAPVMPTGIEVVPPQLTLEVGNTHMLFANIIPNDATYKNIHWQSSNNAIVSVNPDGGMITANQIGEAFINARTQNNLQAQCHVIVVEP